MNVLGINSYFEHPAVALVCDDRLVFAAEDERFTRIKHGRRYNPYAAYVPVEAMEAALSWAALSIGDIDEIAYSYDRWMHLRSLWGCITKKRLSPLRDELAGFAAVANYQHACRYEIPHRYVERLTPAELLRVRFRAWNHHLAHASSAFFCSGYDEALVIVADGAGESACTSIYHGCGDKLRPIACERIPNSLGLFYSFITRHLGFEPFADEYKVMGLAAYGEARFKPALSDVLSACTNGGYVVNMGRLLNLEPILGPARRPSEPVEQTHMDVASSAQAVLEDILAHTIGHHAGRTGLRRLCLAGGTFLNCVANRRLGRLGIFDEIFVQPAAHDAGTAIGAAALSMVDSGRGPQLVYDSMALGTAYGDEPIEAALVDAGVRACRMDDRSMAECLAERLAQNRVCGIFRGRMEFGPRALGMRSILANPTDRAMQQRLNRIKGRERFRPVAPAITSEAFPDYFDGVVNRYMMFTTDARARAYRDMPAAIHADGTARTQVVSADRDAFMHRVLECFGSRSGLPAVINTSFNGREEPIVENPRAALACFFSTGIDCLALGSFLIEKDVQ